MENINSDNREPKCLSCEKYQANPRLGHTKCSVHRDCCGEYLWEPNNCEHCMLLRENYASMTTEERNALLQDLKVMLARMRFNKKARKVDWEYRMIVASFFDTNCPSTATPASYSDENRDSPSDYTDNYNSDGNIKQAAKDQSDDAQERDDNIPDLEQAIDGLDKDTLVSLLRASLQKARGAQQSKDSKYQENKKSRRRKRHHSPDHSTSGSEWERPFQPRLVELVDPLDQPGASNQDNLDNFIDNNNGELYLYVKPYHTFPSSSTVTLNGVVTPIKWHHTRQAFSVSKRSHQEEIPYMSAYQAHDTILAFQNLQPSPIIKDNLNRRCYTRHFTESSGLAKALRILQEDTPTVTNRLFRRKKDEKGATPFSQDTFKPVSMANFETGWTLTGTNFMEWAKGAIINLENVANELDLDYIPVVPIKYLEAEKEARAKLTNHMSGMDMLEVLTQGISELPAAANFALAISRHFTPALKDYTLSWITAKHDIRKYVLQGQTTSAAMNLQKSNIWEPTLFGKSVVTEERNRNSQGIKLQDNIGLHPSFNHGILRFGRYTPPDNLGKSYISRRSRSYSKPSNKGYASSHKRHYTKRYGGDYDSYTNSDYRNNYDQSTQQTRRPQQNKAQQNKQPQQPQTKNNGNNKGKSKNYGKGKGRNFQNNRK